MRFDEAGNDHRLMEPSRAPSAEDARGYDLAGRKAIGSGSTASPSTGRT
jgi:hypothetical protein